MVLVHLQTRDALEEEGVTGSGILPFLMKEMEEKSFFQFLRGICEGDRVSSGFVLGPGGVSWWNCPSCSPGTLPLAPLPSQRPSGRCLSQLQVLLSLDPLRAQLIQ